MFQATSQQRGSLLGKIREEYEEHDQENTEDGQQGRTRRLTTLDTIKDVMIISDPVAPTWGLNDFDIARRLGRGQFGSVFLARERRTGYLVALKTIKKTQLLQTNNEHLLRREIEIHSHLIHPNILGFYGWFTTPELICLILELAPQGELMEQLADGALSEAVAAQYLQQMISAIRTCHRFNVIHRDLKPENILVGVDGKLKLADFGWAAHIPDEPGSQAPLPISAARRAADASAQKYNYLKNRRKTYCGTLDYLSPEICKHEWYGKEVDLWCLGILCYELVTGEPPFSHCQYKMKGLTEEQARKQQQDDIQSCDIKSRLTMQMSENLRDFLTKALDKDPTKRINTDEMLRHPWIRAHNTSSDECDVEKILKIGIPPPPDLHPPPHHMTEADRRSKVSTPGPSPASWTHGNGPVSGGAGADKWSQSRLFMSVATSSPNSRRAGNPAMPPPMAAPASSLFHSSWMAKG